MEEMEVGDQEEKQESIYRVQVGAFGREENAEELLYQLLRQGFPAYTDWEDGYYKVQVGAFNELDNAVKMEAVLRHLGYNTFISS